MKAINETEFEQITKEGVVPVDFFATWCGPCKVLAPALEKLVEDIKDKAEVVKVDVDQESGLAMKLDIVSVLAMIVFKNGGTVKQVSGYQPKTQLTNILNQLLQESQITVEHL